MKIYEMSEFLCSFQQMKSIGMRAKYIRILSFCSIPSNNMTDRKLQHTKIKYVLGKYHISIAPCVEHEHI